MAVPHLRVASGVFLGNVVGTGPITFYTLPIFLVLLTKEFGWSRSLFSGAVLASTIVLAVASPLIGRAADRYGIKTVMIPGIIYFGILVIMLGLNNGSVFILFGLYILLGVGSAVQGPTMYSKIVSQWFFHKRGLTLGLAVGGGLGVGGALMPYVVNTVAETYGWRGAFVALGLLALVVGVSSMALLIREPSAHLGNADQKRKASYGQPAGEAYRSSTFILIAGAMFLAGISITGVMVHSIAIFEERGISRQGALMFLATIGVSQIAGRILSGILQDWMNTPRVALPFLVAPLVGLVLLSYFPPSQPLSIAAGVLLGIGFGAETEIGAYFISRYFGITSFAQIYGTFIAIFAIATGVGPYVMGASYDLVGSYNSILIMFECALVVAIAMIACLGPYTYSVRYDGELTDNGAVESGQRMVS